jgi:hypothetical protein
MCERMGGISMCVSVNVLTFATRTNMKKRTNKCR